MAPPSRRPKRLSASLGDSWGDAEYDEDDDGSIASVSDVDSRSSEDAEEEGAVFTPLPTRDVRIGKSTPRASNTETKRRPSPQQTPVKRSSRGSTPSKHSPSSASKGDSLEPSFIMPSMSGLLDSTPTKSSPLRSSQLSHRQPRRKMSATPESKFRSSPRPSPQSWKGNKIEDDGFEPQPWSYLDLLWMNAIRPMLKYLISVLSFALQAMRPIFGYLLLFFFLAFLLSYTSNLVRTTFLNAMTPVCIIPGSSYLIPFCATSTSDQPKTGHAEFETLMQYQATFEDVLQSSADGASLPLDMKRSESSIRDLKHVVKYSHLPSRSELEVEFEIFISTAQLASRDLTRFNSRIGRAVDQILSTNRWTIQILDGAAEKDAATGLVPKMLGAINPLNAFYTRQTMDQVIFEQYLRHTRTVEELLHSLIQEANALLGILSQLDERLDMISSIATRDGIITQENKDELFERLWTKLGGNRSSIKKLNEQMNLLKSVTWYRKTAWNHVTATLLKLQEIEVGLEDLRDRVAAPEVVGWRDDVPLANHIEHIRLGVERLEKARGDTRTVKGRNYRRILDAAEKEELEQLPGSTAHVKTVYPNH